MQRHNLRAVSFVAVLAVPLILFASGSLFTRLQADDYCFMNAAQQDGVLATVASVYNTWFGRFVATFVIAVFGLTGPGGATILLWASLVVWVGALYGVLSEVLDLLRIQLTRAWRWVAVLLVATGTLAGLPYVEQLLYWPTGVAIYTLPLAFLTLYLYLALSIPQRWWARVSIAALAFLAAGCSDALAPLQLAIVALMILAFWRRPQREALLYAFLGGLLGLIIVAASPGNAERVALVGSTPSIGEAIRLLPEAFGIPLYLTLVNAPLFMLAATGLPALFAMAGPRQYVPSGGLAALIVAIPVVTFALVGLSLAPSLVMLNKVSDPRSWVFAVNLLFLGTLALGYVVGVALDRRRKPTAPHLRLEAGIAALLIFGCALNGLWTASDLVSRQRVFAEAWDVRDAFLRTQSGAQETVRAQSFHGAMGLGDLTDDPAYWVNGCIAAYYGLPTIVKDDAEPIAP